MQPQEPRCSSFQQVPHPPGQIVTAGSVSGLSWGSSALAPGLTKMPSPCSGESLGNSGSNDTHLLCLIRDQRPSLCQQTQSYPLHLGHPVPAPREPTLAFMALWFFLVFFRNCFRLPEDTYSVMKMTWQGREASASQPPCTSQEHAACAGPAHG